MEKCQVSYGVPNATSEEDKRVSLWEVFVPVKLSPEDPEAIPEVYHRAWDAAVLAITQGLTIFKPVRGVWIHAGEEERTYQEFMIPVRIACTLLQIDKILGLTADHYNQVKVFAYKVSDTVLFYSKE